MNFRKTIINAHKFKKLGHNFLLLMHWNAFQQSSSSLYMHEVNIKKKLSEKMAKISKGGTWLRDHDKSKISSVWPRKEHMGFSDNQKSFGTGAGLLLWLLLDLSIRGSDTFPPLVLPSLSIFDILLSCPAFTLPSLSSFMLPSSPSPLLISDRSQLSLSQTE